MTCGETSNTGRLLTSSQKDAAPQSTGLTDDGRRADTREVISEDRLPVSVVAKGLTDILDFGIAEESEVDENDWNAEGRQFPGDSDSIG